MCCLPFVTKTGQLSREYLQSTIVVFRVSCSGAKGKSLESRMFYSLLGIGGLSAVSTVHAVMEHSGIMANGRS